MRLGTKSVHNLLVYRTMDSKNNDITLTIAVLLLVIIAWISRGNLANHCKGRDGVETSVNELETVKRCAVRGDSSLWCLAIYYPFIDSVVFRSHDLLISDKDSSLQLVKNVINTIEADNQIVYTEVSFFKWIRKQLSTRDEKILETLPDKEDYMLSDVESGNG